MLDYAILKSFALLCSALLFAFAGRKGGAGCKGKHCNNLFFASKKASKEYWNENLGHTYLTY